MPKLRTPLRRRTRWHLTPEAVDAYKKMLAAQCTCPIGNGYDCCPAAEEWWKQHQVLRLAVHAPPWIFPVTRDEDLVRALDEAIERES
jgi:hypothetical protein